MPEAGFFDQYPDSTKMTVRRIWTPETVIIIKLLTFRVLKMCLQMCLTYAQEDQEIDLSSCIRLEAFCKPPTFKAPQFI